MFASTEPWSFDSDSEPQAALLSPRSSGGDSFYETVASNADIFRDQDISALQ